MHVCKSMRLFACNFLYTTTTHYIIMVASLVHLQSRVQHPPAGSGARTVPPSESVSKQLVNPHSVRRHHDPMDLVSLAREVSQIQQFSLNDLICGCHYDVMGVNVSMLCIYVY